MQYLLRHTGDGTLTYSSPHIPSRVLSQMGLSRKHKNGKKKKTTQATNTQSYILIVSSFCNPSSPLACLRWQQQQEMRFCLQGLCFPRIAGAPLRCISLSSACWAWRHAWWGCPLVLASSSLCPSALLPHPGLLRGIWAVVLAGSMMPLA